MQFKTNIIPDAIASDMIYILNKCEIYKDKQNVRNARSVRFNKGLFPARPPIGYIKVLKDKKIIGFRQDKKKAAMILDIFEMTAKGIGYKEICDKYKIKPQSYYNIIKNKAYIGIVEFEGEEKDGIHKPIITQELFDKCN